MSYGFTLLNLCYIAVFNMELKWLNATLCKTDSPFLNFLWGKGSYLYVAKLQESQETVSVLGAFAKLRKATISFVLSVCLHGTTQLPLDRF